VASLNPRDPSLIRELRNALRFCGYRDGQGLMLLEAVEKRPGVVLARCQEGPNGLRFEITFGWRQKPQRMRG